MNAKLAAMADPGRDDEREWVEERIFRLLDTDLTTPEIARVLGMRPKEALPLVLKVIDERGTPNLAAARRAIDHLATIRFV
jgi:hypothetical protein